MKWWGFILYVTASAQLMAATEYYRFEMQDGVVIRGSVVSETSETILVALEEQDGISGQTLLNKSQIAQKLRIPADEVAYNRLPSLELHPRHSLPLKEYDALISAAEKFLQDFPGSSHAESVRLKLERFKDERERVAKGQVKSAGEWLGSTEAKLLSYDIKANLLYDELLSLEAKNKFPQAKEVFATLERQYPASLAYFQAGALMVNWLDKQIKSRQVEIEALEGRISLLEKTRDNNNKRLADAQARMSKSTSPSYITAVKNQIASLQHHNASLVKETQSLQSQLSAARQQLDEQKAELERLRQLSVEMMSQQGGILKQVENKFLSGKISEVREMLKNTELRKFERTRTIDAMIGEHDKFIQQMQAEIAAKNYDAAIETGNRALKEFPGSDQINALLQQARKARSETGRAP